MDTFKRGQVDDAIVAMFGAAEDQSRAAELRRRTTRLLQTDRSSGSRFAFSSVRNLGSGAEAKFSAYEAFAVLTALVLAQITLVVWAKTNGGMGSLYRSQHELLPLFKKGTKPHINNIKLGKNRRWRSNLWQYAGSSSLGSDAREGLKDHPTVKPVAMLEDALVDLTNRGDVVLDPFLGSGSTLIAAHRSGRVCCGIEIDPHYVDLVGRRFEALTGVQLVIERRLDRIKDGPRNP